ncbi:hypothetical protein D3P09_02295 [Paenibacillus pinisoli]|uniref:Uncharacterized protein n=1 Tax=Paenibacillus pinisoli TaxID=1276110 RepID=A0A3A6PIC7_9BACL|nr:hypothetical protein D3P09_02295 [Paenibacillus pinisoli]
MLDIKDIPRPISNAITLSIHLADGSIFVQELSVEESEGAQSFLEWYRKPGRAKVWTWQVPSESTLHALHHSHIIGVDMEGYIEPEGRSSKWYERILDRWYVWRWARRGSG